MRARRPPRPRFAAWEAKATTAPSAESTASKASASATAPSGPLAREAISGSPPARRLRNTSERPSEPGGAAVQAIVEPCREVRTERGARAARRDQPLQAGGAVGEPDAVGQRGAADPRVGRLEGDELAVGGERGVVGRAPWRPLRTAEVVHALDPAGLQVAHEPARGRRRAWSVTRGLRRAGPPNCAAGPPSSWRRIARVERQAERGQQAHPHGEQATLPRAGRCDERHSDQTRAGTTR